MGGLQRELAKMEEEKESITTSNRYWFENFSQKSNQIDALCTYAAETLGKIDYEIWRYDNGEYPTGLVASKRLIAMRGEKKALDHILRHFFGFLPLDFLIANDLGRENIERNKTRKQRFNS